LNILSTEKVNFISYDVDKFNATRARLGDGGEPTNAYEIPAGSFENQTKPWIVKGDTLGWAVHADMPEEVVQEFLRIVFENTDKLAEAARMLAS
jgi:TRAP-type uncharacterized transport system substrate-binding protein